MSVEQRVDRDLHVDVDPDENRATIIVTERREVLVEDLFNSNGELRLWEDPAGWSGYLREESESGARYYHVNTRHDCDDWIRKVRVGEQTVHEAVKEHINDPQAGEAGHFVRGATPP